MKFQFQGKSVGSKIIPRVQGSVPAFERTEGEKIRLAVAYLEKRGYVVMPSLISRQEVSALLKCSDAHINNLMSDDEFPQPYDIGSKRKSIDRMQRRLRFSAPDVKAWVLNGLVPKGDE